MIAGTLEIQLLANMAKLSQDMTTAKNVVGGAMKDVEGAIGMVKTAFGILGVAATGAGFAMAIKSAISLQENYVRLGEIAGTTAAQMSAFDLSARLSGTSLDVIATSVAKLSRSLGEAQLGDVAKRGMFKALGIDPNDGRDAAAVMVDVAKALTGMHDQNIAAAASTLLLSRGFAELRPFMKEIVEQGTLNARVTEEQALRAKEFQDNIVKLEFNLKNIAITIANEMLPGLNKIAEAMIRVQKEGGSMAAVLRAAIRQALTGDELEKNAKEIAFLEKAVAVAKSRIDALNAQRAGPNNPALLNLQAQLAGINEQLRIAVQYRQQLMNPEDFSGPAKRKPGVEGGAMDMGVGLDFLTKRSKEDEVRRLMAAQKAYDAQIAALKGFGQRQADEVRLANQLVDLEYKAGAVQNERTQEEALRAKQSNDEKFLASEIARLQKQKSLAEGQGNIKQAAEFQAGIERANAAIVANQTLTEAQIRALRSETLRKAKEEYDNFIAEMARKGEQLADQFGDTGAVEERAYQQRLIALDVFLKENEQRQGEADQIRAGMARQHRDNMSQIAMEEWYNRKLFGEFTNRDLIKTNQYTFAVLQELMQSSSRKMFEVGKAAAIANTIISTYEGAQKAYTALVGIPYVGPFLAAAAAAAAIVVGIQRVQAINNTKFGSNSISAGVGASIGTYSAQPGTNIPANTPASGTQGSQILVNVTVNGHVLDQRAFTDEILVPAIKDAVDNRDVTIIGPNSRQAAELTS